MNTEIRSLEPKPLWNKFADLNAVPRPSKKEERIIAFMLDFGKRLGLETFEDSIRNVIIKKPASKGMEKRKTIVLQSHLDMVHQKNNDTIFDFNSQGIEMYIDSDWVKAKGTTLGADNGIGVATIMAILESKDIAHPAIEALFTIDEETGMTGALGLKGGILNGEILLNLDTEEDTEIDIGCAGGVDVTATRKYITEITPSEHTAYNISVKGLNGGHSGMDIHKGLGNANKIMNRLLYMASTEFLLRVSEINGGSLRNAIPRESNAIVVVPENNVTTFQNSFSRLANDIKNEFKTTETQLQIDIQTTTAPVNVMDYEVQLHFIKSIYSAHNGVYRMSADIPTLVETSNNVAKVTVKNGEIMVACLTRSSVETSKYDLANSLKACFELAGCEVKLSGSYPGWTPNVKSPILDVLVNIYEKLNHTKPQVVSCHAGLECGILGSNYPEMDMISFGPTIKGAHSPDERVSISSVQKYWQFVLDILKNIPEKNK
jgi:dipeptidase D